MANKMKHNVKDSVFTSVFRIPEYSLDMYRSLHPEDSDVTVDDINIITIENILVTGMFNDLGFQIKNRLLILVEAQSTFSVKLSIRLFLYLAETVKKYIEKMEIDLYSDTDIIGYEKKTVLPDGSVLRENPFYRLPTPELYVIYTGEKDVPDELDISDLYDPKPDGSKPLSLKVKIIKSGEKNDYISQYIRFCRAAAMMRKQYPNNLKTAVQKLVEYCRQNKILEKFIEEHQDEVYDMMDVLFNQEYVTQVHENNLVWQGYNQAKEEDRKEIEKAVNDAECARKETEQAKKETEQAKNNAEQAQKNSMQSDMQAVNSIKLLMTVQNMTADEVMDQLGTPAEMRSRYRILLR